MPVTSPLRSTYRRTLEWARKLPAAARAVGLRLALARGLALFFGVFSLANAIPLLRGAASLEDTWWIDLHFLPAPVAVACTLLGAGLLLWWALVPRAGRRRAIVTALACGALALAAYANVLGFYDAWKVGSIVPWMPLPSSALVAAAFAWLAWRTRPAAVPTDVPRGNRVATAIVAALLALAFPLVQIAFFGSTDYRRHADVAVVFGAKVNADGSLSTTLEDRVRTGVDLYRAGLVPRLIMSGAVGETGLDEATAMRDRAVQLGVPADAILLDHEGVNTDATVDDTRRVFSKLDARTVLAVSQFYHLPRIKMAYRAVGVDVQTVPATPSRYIIETPWLVLREIPGFWTYWFRSLVGS